MMYSQQQEMQAAAAHGAGTQASACKQGHLTGMATLSAAPSNTSSSTSSTGTNALMPLSQGECGSLLQLWRQSAHQCKRHLVKTCSLHQLWCCRMLCRQLHTMMLAGSSYQQPSTSQRGQQNRAVVLNSSSSSNMYNSSKQTLVSHCGELTTAGVCLLVLLSLYNHAYALGRH